MAAITGKSPEEIKKEKEEDIAKRSVIILRSSIEKLDDESESENEEGSKL